jgi:hypothetical protein
LAIEIRSGGLIGGAKFDPAEFTRSVFFDIWHGRESVLRGKRGGKSIAKGEKCFSLEREAGRNERGARSIAPLGKKESA